MAREEIKENNTYYSIVRGSFRVQVEPNTEGAIRREYEKKDGSTGVKWERVVNALIGYIEDIQFRDTEFGMQMYVAFNKNDDKSVPVISLGLDMREAQDLLKKLPNINFLKEVKLRPFNFEGTDGDEVRGIEVMQEDENGEFTVKVKNYFRDTDKKVNINGMPVPEGDTADYSKDDWKIYFLQVKKFLKAYTEGHVCAKVAQAVIDRGTVIPTSKEQEDRIKDVYPKEQEINPDDIPW